MKTDDGPGQSLETCYRHADRFTGVHCTRCGNPVCPDCMTAAPVGHHCPSCIAEAKGDMRQVQRFQWRNPLQGSFPVVKVLMALNAVVFLLQQSSPDFDVRFADNPILVAEVGEVYRMLTATFMHVNLIHIALNMYSLWIAGSQVETLLGSPRFTALYLASGIGGSALFVWLGDPTTFAMGASGAIFGLFGALFVMARARGFDARPIGALIVLNLLFGFTSGLVDNYGHVGGLLTGVAIALVFQATDRLPKSTRWAAWLGTALVLAAIVVGATSRSIF